MVARRSIECLAAVFAALMFASTVHGQEAADSSKSPDKTGPMTEAPPSDAASESATSTEATRTPAPVSAEDILKEFQRERPTAEPLLPQPRPGETIVREPEDESARGEPLGASTAGNRARLPDGYILVDRSGRLQRDGEWWVISFVSDNHPDTLPEPPMRLLPNRMLERMVRESESTAQTVEFIVSGEVTDFLGDNYLLLRKLLRKRNMGNLSR